MSMDFEGVVGELGRELIRRGLSMATAESCTGGLVASTLTDTAGSSEWFDGGVVAYSNSVKMKLLGVSEVVLIEHGAVSRACVEAMVRGVSSQLDVPVAVALSGIAGPGGGSAEKPVGTVWVAWMTCGRVWSRKFLFSGDRLAVKRQSLEAALVELLLAIKNGASGDAPKKNRNGPGGVS